MKNIYILSIKKFPYFLTHVLDERGIRTCKIKEGGEKMKRCPPFFATMGKQREIPTDSGRKKKKKKMLVDKVERFN